MAAATGSIVGIVSFANVVVVPGILTVMPVPVKLPARFHVGGNGEQLGLGLADAMPS